MRWYHAIVFVFLGVAIARPNTVSAAPTQQTESVREVRISAAGGSDITVLGGTSSRVRARMDERELPVRRQDGRVEIRIPGAGDEVTVEVPRTVQLRIETRAGDIRVRGVGGRITAETTAGDIAVTGTAVAVEAETVAGDIEIGHTKAELRVRTVSGDVSIERAQGKVDIKLTSGDIAIADARADDVRISTMSGDIRYRGYFTGQNTHHLKTHRGEIALELARDKPVELELATMSGEIDSDFTPAERTRSRALVRVGAGGPTVRVWTMSGDIDLRAGD